MSYKNTLVLVVIFGGFPHREILLGSVGMHIKALGHSLRRPVGRQDCSADLLS